MRSDTTTFATPTTCIASEDGQDREVWLLGQPSLSSYLDYVHDSVVGGTEIPRHRLVSEWRAANDYYQELEDTEYGVADHVECLPLPTSMTPLAEKLRKRMHFRRTFDTFPTVIAWVEIDKLVVCQTSVGGFLLNHREDLGAEQLSQPDLLFQYCFPTESNGASVQATRLGSTRWQFRSGSSDFRLHGVKKLDPQQLGHIPSFGPVAAVVAVVLGYGCNYVNAIQAEGRLILNNGYHRIYTLRSLGITHAPCVIQTSTRGEELGLLAKSKVAKDPDFYINSARPPLIKDFFDPRIRKELRVKRQCQVIDVKVELRESFTTQ